MYVLVVDDEVEILRMFEKWLPNERFHLECAKGGRRALELINKKSFDVVLLDIIMPGVSAGEVLEKIKEVSPQTRVIIISGQIVGQNQLDNLEKMGADGFVQKPFSMDEIMDIIQG
jgi:DNA-binding NtrC family response regulator